MEEREAHRHPNLTMSKQQMKNKSCGKKNSMIVIRPPVRFCWNPLQKRNKRLHTEFATGGRTINEHSRFLSFFFCFIFNSLSSISKIINKWNINDARSFKKNINLYLIIIIFKKLQELGGSWSSAWKRCESKLISHRDLWEIMKTMSAIDGVSANGSISNWAQWKMSFEKESVTCRAYRIKRPIVQKPKTCLSSLKKKNKKQENKIWKGEQRLILVLDRQCIPCTTSAMEWETLWLLHSCCIHNRETL